MGPEVSRRGGGADDPRLLPWPADLQRRAKKLAGVKVSILIQGEPGVGKSLLAEAIHLWGFCAEGPFVRADGARIPEGLAESTLFGHVRGAFTGATGPRPGRVRKADGGTLFVDEVHMMSLRTQGLLLTLAEEGTVIPVGSDEERPVNVRLIFGTNRDLEDLVGRGQFLPDLYARIRAAELRVPPLRERRSELKAIIAAVVSDVRAKEFRGRPPWPLDVTDEAIEELRDLPWPENIRGLRNALVQGFIEARGEPLSPEHLEMGSGGSRRDGAAMTHSGNHSRKTTRARYSGAGDPRERERMETALRASGGNVTRAARELGISRSWLYDRLGAHGLDPGAYREGG